LFTIFRLSNENDSQYTKGRFIAQIGNAVIDLQAAIEALNNGGVIAYPTEGVFGVGCDPDNQQALESLLNIKQRDPSKGLILIASSFEQLMPYVDLSQVTSEQLERATRTWPGPFTWVIPASERLLSLVSGQFDSVAVRVTDHPLVIELCEQFGKPITSTSANLSGQPACITYQEVEQQLGDTAVVIVKGQTGGRQGPSEIRDILTSTTLRQG
jgi:L-threonylcarbamoyladenylate synthase